VILNRLVMYIFLHFNLQHAQPSLGLPGRIVMASGKSEPKSPASSCARA
jgi:hypothetical protein